MLERIFKGHTARVRITFGLSGMLVTLLLLASMAGLVPDRHAAIRDGHARLAETIAVSSSIFITTSDIRRMRANLEVVVARNDDILSAGVRRKDGSELAIIGDHASQWQTFEQGLSSDSQVVVPIFEGSEEWGQVELRFKPLLPVTWYGSLMHPTFLLLGFMSITSLILFFFYLGKMLKQLDPSQAVPDRVRSALDTMAEGLLVIDVRQNVVLANTAFASLVDESSDQLLGRQMIRFAWSDPEDQPLAAELAPWSKTLKDGLVRTADMIRLRCGDGSNRSFMTNCSPILSGSGKPVGVLISFDDVTELEQKELELRISRDEAEQANRFKSEFLANMSHEIRTPMNAILGFSEVLKRGYDRNSKDSIRYLNTISSSGNHLLNLINDILDLSKIESGKIEVEIIQTPVHQVIHEVIQIMQVKADEKNIYLRFEPSAPLPEFIHTDAGKLRQIVTNLVGNAVKFTTSGGVRVVTRLQEDADEAMLFVDVFDSGIGMTQQQAVDVFNPFTQADSSITRRFGGTGLGLTISKRFAEALGGDILVESEPGEGSRFSAAVATGKIAGVKRLPIDEILSGQWQEVSGETKHWKFPESKILVVDDGEENRELLQVVLGDIGIAVVTAENGQIALDRLASETFDMVLMDVQMPVMDGYTAVRAMRERNFTLPVIAMTADAMLGAQQKCLDAGYSEYMTKPIDIDYLLERLAELLGGELLGETPDRLPFEEQPRVAASSSEPAVIYSSLPMSNPKFRGIVEKFVTRLGDQLAAIDAAWEHRDYVQMKSLVHWLKGSAGSVGFSQFVEPARALEQFSLDRDETSIAETIQKLHQIYSRVALEPGPAPRMATQPGRADNEYAMPLKLVPRFIDSKPRLRLTIGEFIDQLASRCAGAEEAVANKNYAEIEKFGYWLKVSGESLGFPVFIEQARNLEVYAKEKKLESIQNTIAVIRQLNSRIETTGVEKGDLASND
jgi:PAS domain S-box-containing protein